jgi:hypothetical protein
MNVLGLLDREDFYELVIAFRSGVEYDLEEFDRATILFYYSPSTTTSLLPFFNSLTQLQ